MEVHAGLLDLVPSRSGTVFAAWLTRRTAAFRDGVQVATLDYFTTERSSTGGTEAINGVIELRRRIARGYRNRENYRLRMLLVAGGLDSRPLPDVR